MSSKQQHILIKDFLVSGEEFSLKPNERFGFLETTPQPRGEDLFKYYESEDYISHTDSKKGILAFVYQMVKKYSLNKKQALVRNLNSGKGSLLDIGAGTGEFLKVAEMKGWSISGVEPNAKARSFAKTKEVSLIERIDDLDGTQYDVVTLWHVLEHLPDLERTVAKIEQLVKAGGCLVIAVPNHNSYDAKFYENYWAAFDVPRHLWHFSQSSMKKLFTGKMKLEKTKPMLFDSFYVSLLSEKYKTGNNFSIRAFLVGLKSNLLAMSSKEYSSLIYCFRKTE